MDERKLYVVVTMDCERIRTESYRNDGTASWEMSEKAVLGLAELLEGEGLKGVFLPTPATAAVQPGVFHQVREAGHEVGMQFHCDSFRDGRYRSVLGSYGREEQRQILTEAKDDWEQAMGLPLLTYRSGYLSASDDTFPILAELGIKQTSCSKAGRYRPEIAARWLGALPYAHRASATCRLESGDLDLVEVPVTSHPAERFSLTCSFDPKDPRPDSNYAPEVYSGIVDAALHEMALLQPKVATFVILTHNTLDYGSTEEPRRALMLSMLRYLKAKADEGWEVIPAGLADVRQALLA
jgi:hypothetical protein